MKRSKYTEEQIAFALKQAEVATLVEEVCRKMGVRTRRSTTGERYTAVWGRRNSVS